MRKKIFAILLATLLVCLFCLAAAAAPSQEDMDKLTPYELTVLVIVGEKNGSAILSFRIDELGRRLAGMDKGDDVNVKVEYRRGDGDWSPWYDYSSQRMFENQTTIGVFELEFDWVFDNKWDGAEPIRFRAYCEYMQGGNIGTGIISGYSNEEYIGVMGEDEAVEPPADGEFLPIEPRDALVDEESSGAMAINLALLLWIGAGLLVLLLIVVIIIAASKKKKKN